jgi:exodeoxyribonuclease V beta subunit
LVHAVLEQIDFSVGTEKVAEQIGAAIDRALSIHPVDLTPVDPLGGSPGDGRRLLIEGITEALGASLGPLFGHRRLADIGRKDRLDELSFDFRLGESGSVAKVSDIGRLVGAYLGSGDPLAEWAANLAAAGTDLRLAGHLTGSIDLVLRIADPTGEDDRYVVVDYKTNALAVQGLGPRPDDYRRARMTEAMVAHDYPLQALLYSVCLHRYLRWRLPDYQPERHLGGVAYLFVRGMFGPVTDTADDEPEGVFGWPIPSALVEALSDLLDGRPIDGLLP